MTECSIDLSIWSESLRTTAFPEGDASANYHLLISSDGSPLLVAASRVCVDILGDSEGVEPCHMDGLTYIPMLRVCLDDLVKHYGCSRLVPSERPKLSTWFNWL